MLRLPVVCLVGLVLGAVATGSDDSVGLIQGRVSIDPTTLETHSFKFDFGAAGNLLNTKMQSMSSADLWSQMKASADPHALMNTVAHAKQPGGSGISGGSAMSDAMAAQFIDALTGGLKLFEEAANETLLVQEHLFHHTQLAMDELAEVANTVNASSENANKELKGLKKAVKKAVKAVADAWDNFIVVPAKHVKIIKDYYVEGAGKWIPQGDQMADMTWGAGWMATHQIVHSETIDKLINLCDSNKSMTVADHLQDLNEIAASVLSNRNQMLANCVPFLGTVADPKLCTIEDMAPMMASPMGPYMSKATLQVMVDNTNLVASVNMGQMKWFTETFSIGMLRALHEAGIDASAAAGRMGLGLLAALASAAFALFLQ